jgi:hypothetical protein
MKSNRDEAQMAGRVGRPKKELPRAKHLFTRRFRALMHLAHEGNLGEGSRATGISYPTLRDLYVGRTVNPGLRTLEALADTYGVSLPWFRDPAEPEEVPVEGRVGYLPPEPYAASARPHLREIVIPFAAWPMYRVFTVLERRLALGEPRPDRPIVGEATGDALTFRLTTFLFQPLLAAEKAGVKHLILEGAGGGNPAWVLRLRSLGAIWELALADLLTGS